MSFRALAIVIQHHHITSRPLQSQTGWISRAEEKENAESSLSGNREPLGSAESSCNINFYAAHAFRCENFLLLLIYDLFTVVYFIDIKLTSIMRLTDKTSIYLCVDMLHEFIPRGLTRISPEISAVYFCTSTNFYAKKYFLFSSAFYSLILKLWSSSAQKEK